MEKFAGYGFNKSHSAAYALLSYQTAWLKAHYPAAFMAAVLSADMDDTDKVVTLVDECARMGLDGAAAGRQRLAATMFTRGRATAGASATASARSRASGAGAVESARRRARRAAARSRASRDLCRRIDLTRVNRRVLEALIRSGSLDALGAESRHADGTGCRPPCRRGEQTRARAQAGQDDMFGLATSARAAAERCESQSCRSGARPCGSPASARRSGLYLTGHPIDRLRARPAAPRQRRASRDLGERRTGRRGERRSRYAGGRRSPSPGWSLEMRKRGDRTSFVLDDAPAASR